MLCRPASRNRSAASALEAAIVLPLTFFLVLGIMIGGMGIFRYQEMAHIARETARCASVHGGQYAKQNAAAIKAGTLPSVDENYLVNYAKSLAVSLDPSQLNVAVTMTVITPGAASASSTETVDWDNTTENQNRSPYSAWINNNTNPPSHVQADNIVIVKVSYSWSPGLYLVGPINLSSTAVMAMSY
jgi:Flp pilus assembly protein TadG